MHIESSRPVRPVMIAVKADDFDRVLGHLG
jgi:hypothetical protein